jgi:hypothetical protein
MSQTYSERQHSFELESSMNEDTLPLEEKIETLSERAKEVITFEN